MDSLPETLVQRVGRLVHETRQLIGWTQRELADRAHAAQTTVWRLENGAGDGIAFATVGRVLDALGVRWVIEPALTQARVEQRDAAHAHCSAYVRRRLESLGWTVEQEAEFGDGRGRGWIDILAFEAQAEIAFVDEIKTALPDVGGLLRQVSWYERAAWSAARTRGWRPRRVIVGVTLLFTEENDAAVVANRELFAQTFPVRAREFGGLLAVPAASVDPRGRALALIDPLSRRRDWLRPAWADGRRSPAPYRNYADFMRIVRERSRLPR